MKNVIVVQLRRILQQTVRAATNISSVRRSLLLESSTWYVLDDARVRAFPSSLNTVTAYPTKRRLHRLHLNYLHTRSNRSIFARSRNKQISSILLSNTHSVSAIFRRADIFRCSNDDNTKDLYRTRIVTDDG